MVYEYWLASLKGISAKKKKRLREIFGSAKRLYYIEEKELGSLGFLREKDAETLKRAKQETGLEKNFQKLEEMRIRFLPFFHKDYPKRLLVCPDFPYALYVKGELPGEERPAAAIVGARRCTPYGEALALEYGEALARAGVQVISGMARGIDGAGQRGALNGGGKSFAVLGCGVDICYPREHIGLYTDLLRCGGVLSEQPPKEPPLPAYFPQRNRIISGLSDVILVMEARKKSGSLITADLGLEQGKDVYALPGPVTSPLSAGCHALIQQGAGLLSSPEELLAELGLLAEGPLEEAGARTSEASGDTSCRAPQKDGKNKKELETPENMVYSCLDFHPKHINELITRTGLRPQEVLQGLTSLEIRGDICEISKNYYVKVRR